MHKQILFLVTLVVSVVSKADAGIIDFNEDPVTLITPFVRGDLNDFIFTATTPGSAGVTLASNITGGSTNGFAFTAGNIITVNYTGTGTFTLKSLDLGRTTSVPSDPDPAFTISGFNGVTPGGVVNTPTLGTLTPTLFGVTLSNLTRVVITATREAAFDKFDYEINAAAAVPEPASAAFLGLGSLALVVRRLRRRSSVVA
jgi:hypothetical protein